VTAPSVRRRFDNRSVIVHRHRRSRRRRRCRHHRRAPGCPVWPARSYRGDHDCRSR